SCTGSGQGSTEGRSRTEERSVGEVELWSDEWLMVVELMVESDESEEPFPLTLPSPRGRGSVLGAGNGLLDLWIDGLVDTGCWSFPLAPGRVEGRESRVE